MAIEPVFEAMVDPTRNLVRTRFAGDLRATDLRAAANRIEALLPQLKPGFTVLADFSGISSMDLDCAPPLTRVMEFYREHGIGLIVRVRPPPSRDIGISILGVVHYRGKVKTVTVDSPAEAERVLG